jgi:1-acyl-sn-glycerol-3-phosphate acyltransferase
MQAVVIDKPYQFIPPYRSAFWIRLFGSLLARHLRSKWGIESCECRGLENLKESLAQGHGVLLAPNHCRPCDPMLMGVISRAVQRPFFSMASWHIFFEAGRFQGWLANRLGAFSVNRWGMDREALKAAIAILAEAHRPLVLFPEGHITRTNDHLHGLLAGTAFIARSAARQRAKDGGAGKVVIHPVAIKYVFNGDVERTVTPILDEIETRLSWQKQSGKPTYDRIVKVGTAMLALKEIDYLGKPQEGTIAERLERLIDCLLQPLEKQWAGGRRQSSTAERAKVLRMAIVPELAAGELPEPEREQRWRQLADVYLAQQLALYPADYIASDPTPERILETVERFEEDLTDRARIHRPFHAILQVGSAIEAGPDRERGGDDPLVGQVEQQLKAMLVKLSAEVRASRVKGESGT